MGVTNDSTLGKTPDFLLLLTLKTIVLLTVDVVLVLYYYFESLHLEL